jgi:hypothetical protein
MVVAERFDSLDLANEQSLNSELLCLLQGALGKLIARDTGWEP